MEMLCHCHSECHRMAANVYVKFSKCDASVSIQFETVLANDIPAFASIREFQSDYNVRSDANMYEWNANDMRLAWKLSKWGAFTWMNDHHSRYQLLIALPRMLLFKIEAAQILLHLYLSLVYKLFTFLLANQSGNWFDWHEYEWNIGSTNMSE